jgi:raffinose/stachyose/melibiose transport system substrate-binding protein
MRRPLLTLFAVLVLVIAACGGGEGTTTTGAGATTTTAAGATTTAAPDTTEAAPEPVTIEWWHIHNSGPMLALWEELAGEFMDANPNVTINISVYENEAFKAALQAAMQAGDVPDLFQSWGGGGLREQVEAGLVRDITDLSAGFIDTLNPGAAGLYQVDGTQYAIPFNLGIVGFWYNTEMFEAAGIEAPPATWEEFLEDVQTLKDSGVIPIAVGAGDKWPAHFYYTYLMARIGGEAAMNQAAATLDFNVPEFVEAGEELKRLIDMEPFQPGFLSTPWDGADGEAGWIGSEQAAISLMGQWGAGAYRTNSPTGPEGDRPPVAWFPFPAVEGGSGAGTDAVGGGDGIAVGKDAPDEAVQFLEYISSLEVANRIGATGVVLPVTIGAEDSVEDPNLRLVLAGRSEATFVQLYLDQFFSPELGAAINDAVQTLFAGTATPEEVAAAITDAAR